MNSFRGSTLLLLLKCASLPICAQTIVKLSGEVIDEQTKQPLQFASVLLKNRSIGTITNGDGKFDIFIPNESGADTLVFSFLGYSPYSVPVSELAVSSVNVVALKEKILVLDEVVVKRDNPTAQEIISRAYDNLDRNYPTKPYNYSGFIREVWSENKRTVSLVESAVDVLDNGYRVPKAKNTKVNEKVDLKFARASDNNMNNTFKPFMERFNALKSALKWNQVKYPNQEVIGNIQNKQLTLESVVSSNERVLYVVSFITHSLSNNLFERKDIYFIDDETFAIKRVESREYSRSGKYRSQAWSIDSNHSYQAKDVVTVYEFEEYKGKMYLRYFHEIGEADIQNTKTKAIEYEIEGEVMFVITDIKDSGGLRASTNTMDDEKSLALQTTAYDENFWKNYEQIKLVPLTEKQVRDLEFKEGLAEQFVRSGARSRKAKVEK